MSSRYRKCSFMLGEVLADGYSVNVLQPNARRVAADHEGDVPNDCLPHGIEKMRCWTPEPDIEREDLVDHGERASKLLRALQAAGELLQSSKASLPALLASTVPNQTLMQFH
jgi:hypothetical protein